jgi:hypothetical protein
MPHGSISFDGAFESKMIKKPRLPKPAGFFYYEKDRLFLSHPFDPLQTPHGNLCDTDIKYP